MNVTLPQGTTAVLRSQPGTMLLCTLRGRDGVRWRCTRQANGHAILVSDDLPGVTITMQPEGSSWECMVFVRPDRSLVAAQQALRALEAA